MHEVKNLTYKRLSKLSAIELSKKRMILINEYIEWSKRLNLPILSSLLGDFSKGFKDVAKINKTSKVITKKKALLKFRDMSERVQQDINFAIDTRNGQLLDWFSRVKKQKRFTKKFFELERKVTKDIITIGKRNFRTKNYIKLVKRVWSDKAYNEGVVAKVLEDGNDLVVVSSHKSPNFCRMYENKIFSISGTHKLYPSLSKTINSGPPYHPNCLHFLKPTTKRTNMEKGMLTKREHVSLLTKAGQEFLIKNNKLK